MPRVLTVDDSRAIRSMITKQVIELGFEVDEAEHGEEGLARLEEIAYDLVLLDVTMPVLDGPGMLAKMREAGNKTPVLMLTSESKRSIVATVMKQGIEDYILKPFKPEELRAKVLKALRMDGRPLPASAPAPTAAASEPVAAVTAPSHAPGAPLPAGKAFVDVLVIDDMENVHKKLRSMFPAHVSLCGMSSGQAALSAARDKVFRVVLLDTEMPDVSSSVLLGQLKALQPHASFFGMCLRTSNDAEKELRTQGYDGVLHKPFDQVSVEDFLLLHFDNQDLLTSEDNMAKVSAYTGREDKADRYFRRIEELTEPFLARAAAACHDFVVLDITKAPARADRTPRLVLAVEKQAKKLGLQLRLVGPGELGQILSGFSETAAIPLFDTVERARAA